MIRELEGVKPGDTIMVNARYGGDFSLHTVERITATRAVCGENAFMIDSGIQVGTRSGGRWPSSLYGRLVTPEKAEELRAELGVKSRISRANIAIERLKITAANLEAAEAFILASQPAAKEPQP